ncbi:uncharacterized protein METZ01_LOCUS347851 [marine metagenome]|uniref:Uncharacterized protein n=1 Tax=marine metagenome TaxID=408172 RepID=A0A382RCW7_9ZZZZ
MEVICSGSMKVLQTFLISELYTTQVMQVLTFLMHYRRS